MPLNRTFSNRTDLKGRPFWNDPEGERVIAALNEDIELEPFVTLKSAELIRYAVRQLVDQLSSEEDEQPL